jgi:hypothetical protein
MLLYNEVTISLVQNSTAWNFPFARQVFVLLLLIALDDVWSR